MSVCFFQNGVNIGTSAGWGGYTGSNNYVVRYDFVTGASGASGVSIALSGIYYGSNAGTQGFGFKISDSALAYANVRNITPDSSLGYMSYSDSSGYCCTLTADGLNLKANTRYYVFIYSATGGTEYYSGWNCTAPAIYTTGSFTELCSTISAISSQTATLGEVSIVMNRAGDCWHRASFMYKGELLGRSDAFAAALSYVCPRSWFEKETTSVSLGIDVLVQSYTDADCTNASGAAQSGRFILTADEGMRPRLAEGAVSVQALNTGTASVFSDYITGISRARISFDESGTDLSACAGAEISGYRIELRGERIDSSESVIDTEVLNADGKIICTVTDTRGREDSAEIYISLLPYVAPSLTSLSAARCDADGSFNESGLYCRIKANLTFTKLNGKNSAAVSACIKPTGSDWGEEIELAGFENGAWSHQWTAPTLLGGALTGDSYTLRLTVSDLAGGRGEYTLQLYHRQWAMKFNQNGSAVGFGMSPTAENALQLPDSWKLYAGAIVLSVNSYGSELPDETASEGQLFFLLEE